MIGLKPLREQVIAITGASSGIGLATACRAARAGAKVFLIGRDAGTLEPIIDAIRSQGGTADFAVADVGDRDALGRAADLAMRAFGRLDTWIGNAGVAIYSNLLDTPRDEHERLFRTNYWGAVNGAEIAVPRLEASGGGVLITVGSLASDMGSPVMGAYAASKHAVKGYLDSLRIELNRNRVPVVVTLVQPSGIDTPLPAHVANHRAGGARIPPPIYSPDLVARTILHVAEHRTSEITVGGLGLAQVVFATHFPRLFSRIAGAITPILNDSRRRRMDDDNLFTAGDGGSIRGADAGRSFSFYTDGRLHPLIAVSAAAATVVAARLLVGRKTRRPRGLARGR